MRWWPYVFLVAILVTVSSVVGAAQQASTERLDIERSSANQGDADAQFNMARRYFGGRGVAPHIGLSIFWYEAAADQDHVLAQADLAYIYASGLGGVQRDLVQGYMWFTISAARSAGRQKEQAIRTRETFSGDMTPDQIAEAQRLARGWDEAHPRNAPPLVPVERPTSQR